MAPLVRPDQPIAVELVSTLHVVDGAPFDALSTVTDLGEWVRANRSRLPAAVDGEDALHRLRSLRDVLDRLFRAATSARQHDTGDVAALNEVAAVSPPRPQLLWPMDGTPSAVSAHPDGDLPTVLGVLARDGIDVLASGELHACGAPSCVLFFVPRTARQAWCSPACGNRARVARHYERRRTGRQL